MLTHYYDDADVAHGVAVHADAFVNATYVDEYGITMMTTTMMMIMLVLRMMTITLC
jgi:hypothetical protein